MKKLLAIVLLSFCFATHALLLAPEYYRIQGAQVFYKNTLIKSADSTTFKITTPSQFAKDKNQVYFKGEVIEGADPVTFESTPTYGKDKDNIYFIVYALKKGQPTLQIIPNADVASFQEIGFGYFKDKHSVYYNEQVLPALSNSYYIQNNGYAWDENATRFTGKPIEQADAQTFAVLEYKIPSDSRPLPFGFGVKPQHHYAKDKNTVYYRGQVISDAKSDSFEMVSFDCAKDEIAVYCHGNKVTTPIDAASFAYLYQPDSISATPYYRDKSRVYHYSTDQDLNAVEGADPDSFTFGKYGRYAVDKTSVFFDSKIIKGSDGPSFSVLKNTTLAYVKNKTLYAKDKNQVYFRGQVIPQANPEMFTVFATSVNDISKDNQHVFNGLNIIEGTDPQSFELFERNVLDFDSPYTKDKNFVYYLFKPIENADPGSFSHVSGTNYYRDKHHIFYEGEILLGVDLDTFEVTGYYDAKDKDYIYHKGERVSPNNP